MRYLFLFLFLSFSSPLIAGSLSRDGKDAPPAVPVTTPIRSDTQQTIPEPLSWSFPNVIESARAICPRNIEGRKFDQFGLAYPNKNLESLPVATMLPMELQKYADIVTHAYPDAVFRQFPASCKEIPIEKINATAVAGVAYISLHAIDPATRKRAETCLKEVQNLLGKRK